MVAFQALKTPTAVAGWLVERLAQADGALALLALRLGEITRSRTHAAGLSLERLSGELRRTSGEFLTRRSLQLARMEPLPAEAARTLLAARRTYIERASEFIEAHRPERLLKLGFALLRAGDRPLVSVRGIRPGDAVAVRLADGTFTATVNTTQPCRKKS